MKTSLKKVLYLILFFAFLLFLSLNRHSKAGINNYHSEIWADKAGYYVYLPAFFVYNFDSEKLPEDIEARTGYGFSTENDKIRTKYPYGVALMQSPFFLISHYFSDKSDQKNYGFSMLNHKAIDIAAVFYTLISFIFLFLFLRRYYSETVCYLTILFLYLGTNLFYYSIFETGMSHIYSFCLFSIFLYISPFLLLENQKKIFFMLFGLLIGFIIAVRPMNIIFLPTYFIFNKFKFSQLQSKFLHIFIVIFSCLLVLIPQFIYWNYISGSFFHYSYGSEGFSNFFNGKFIHLLFSTNNGLILYSPILIFAIVGLFLTSKSLIPNKKLLIVYFALLVYIFSSWHDWTYGCSFGSRPFVEYFAVLAFPFGFFLKKYLLESNFKLVFIPVFVFLVGVNLKLAFSYDGCWFGGEWDWNSFFNLLFGPAK